ncbi:T9SS type A sorting domain-containing protein, partial [Aquimarina sp. M1]
EYRVASSTNGARLSADLNAGTLVLGEVDIPNTGGWQNWTTVSHTVNVNAGTYPFGIYAVSGGWNINWIKITNQDTQRLNEIVGTQSDDLKITVYPNPVETTLFYSSDLKTSSIEIISADGSLVSRDKTAANNVDVSSLESGVYFIIITDKGGKKMAKRFIKQ